MIASLGYELIIELPRNGLFSMSQFYFLKNILNDVILFNNDNRDKRISLTVIDYDGTFYRSERPNVIVFMDYLEKKITREIQFDEELENIYVRKYFPEILPKCSHYGVIIDQWVNKVSFLEEGQVTVLWFKDCCKIKYVG